jgi:homoserine dehydrogenase
MASTARHGTAVDPRGPRPSRISAPAASVEAFWPRRRGCGIELTTLNPVTGQPAIDHIRAALQRDMPVVTAQAHRTRWRTCARGRAPQLLFRFEATVMDGTGFQPGPQTICRA